MQKEILRSVEANTYFKLDPRTKLMLMLIINISIFGGAIIYIMLLMAAIPLFLLFVNKKIKPALYCTLAYTLAILINEFLVPVTYGILNIFIVMVSGMLYRMMPGFIMGYYLISTTTVSEFIASMEHMHVPQKIIIPMAVMFRFFPTIGEEARSISNAMRMRRVGFSSGGFFKNPILMLEYRLIPLLMSTVKIGDELSAASLTRGLGGPVKRTNICEIGFGIQDIILSIIAVTTFIGFILL
ncbi:energy-coupling factor transporter transmembrane protein EcfT [Iocasia frigidifontis]|uniref:Energy-coupling factor transporter transmembrane protein EcfT n=1 Tax=Iocasia fonsfrigidae TaxID=2682810 RepID=A0A8A7KJ57_9FIRM|nr:energy-coupling factor transporter transmembrane component T [Iocasia fonsfrigidae]QTL98867.1 energy-coupling factor transporter transmembrane protein EcfT [Iocasia fonsfrigidae]